MKTDHKFNPRNQTEIMIRSAMENASEILCNVLKVNVTLRMERMNGWGRADAFHAGAWIEEKGLVKINMRNLYATPLEWILEILGHEFRHAVQSIHKVCDTVPNEDISKNRRYTNSYWNSRFEKDARKYQKAYARIVYESAEFRYKESLKSIVPGEPLKIPDYIATYEKMGVTQEQVRLFRNRDGTLFWFKLEDVNGNKKRWTGSVQQKVWREQADQLRSQKLELLYRDVTLDDLIS